jgi:hypothetical protein
MLKIILWAILIYFTFSIYLLYKRGKISSKSNSKSSENKNFRNLDIKEAEFEDLDE